MKSSEIRARILADHEKLRGRLDAVAGLARRVARGEQDAVAALRERGLDLQARFSEHLDLEDRILLPALRRCGVGGAERARQIAREHTEQRMLLAYIVERLLDQSRPVLVLGRDLQSFVDALLEDIEDEEKTALSETLLGDDAQTRET